MREPEMIGSGAASMQMSNNAAAEKPGSAKYRDTCPGTRRTYAVARPDAIAFQPAYYCKGFLATGPALIFTGREREQRAHIIQSNSLSAGPSK
jgi:hypothetical protein